MSKSSVLARGNVQRSACRTCSMVICAPRVRRVLSILAVLILLAAGLLGVRVQKFKSGCAVGHGWKCRSEVFKFSQDGIPLIESSGDTFISSAPPPQDDRSWISRLISGDMYGLSSKLMTPIRGDGVHGLWTYKFGADDIGMSSGECQAAFPRMFGELARAQSQYRLTHITEEDLDAINITPGRVRAAILDGELVVLQASFETAEERVRAVSILASLHEAVDGFEDTAIPNVEFVISANNQVPDLGQPLWVPDRGVQDERVWLMPDSGFVVQPIKGVAAQQTELRRRRGVKAWLGVEDKSETVSVEQAMPSTFMAIPRSRLLQEIDAIESTTPFEAKSKFLIGVWSAPDMPQNVRRRELVRHAEGNEWDRTSMDTNATEGAIDKKSSEVPGSQVAQSGLSVPEMCKNAFLAHDSSFNMRLTDGPLLCNSVIITTKPQWIQIYHHLMLGSNRRYKGGKDVVRDWRDAGVGPQNVVAMADDWGDLAPRVQGLVDDPDIAAAIARNNVNTFRRRYLTKAATACYWRELVYTYRAVSFEPEIWTRYPGDDQNSTVRRGLEWESFVMLDNKLQMAFDSSSITR